MPKFKFRDLENVKKTSDRHAYIYDFISKCTNEDPVYLSDLIARKEGDGGSVLQKLGMVQEEKARYGNGMKWKIKVLCDEWGNLLGPGDSIKKRIQKPLKDPRTGKTYSPRQMSMAMNDGSYEERFINIVEFPVDKKGCIECNFEDAVSFLNLNGVHGETGRTLTTKPQQSNSPLDCPNGQKLHKHHWRYKEVTVEQYDKLKTVKKREEPLRGLDDKEEIDLWNEVQKDAGDK